MLWYKSWLDTRWRFLIGLALLCCMAIVVVFTRPEVAKLIPVAGTLDTSGEIGRRIKDTVELSREYRGYVWAQWFRQNLLQLATLFAVLLGSGGLISGAGTLFMLSMPASRSRLIWVRASAGLAELLVLVFVPSLLIPLLSPAIGESYGITNALVHSICLFVAGAAFFSLALLLSTIFHDLWRPLLAALSIAVLLAVVPPASSSIFAVMSGESYFRTGQMPWLGLLASIGASAAMLYFAVVNIGHRDF